MCKWKCGELHFSSPNSPLLLGFIDSLQRKSFEDSDFAGFLLPFWFPKRRYPNRPTAWF